MLTNVISKTQKVEAKFHKNEAASYLESFKYDCQLRNLTDNTIDCYFERLAYLLDYLQERETGFTSVDKSLIKEYVMSLKGKVSDETINGRIRVYRCFFNFLESEDIWEGENPLKGIQLLKTAQRVKPVINPEEMQRILKSIGKRTIECCRNRTMILLFWDGMLRQNELLNLKLSDVDLDSRLLKVFGKGRKERMVPLGVKTLRLLNQFLTKWRSKYPGQHLICMRNGEPIKQRHCHKIIQRLGEKHGIKLYPHLLRHSAATYYTQQGGNPAILQKILGHSSLLVTQNYLHLSSADAVKSYDLYSPSNCLII